jgi:hypothetical protein
MMADITILRALRTGQADGLRETVREIGEVRR